MGTTRDPSWPAAFGSLRRFILDTGVQDPETGLQRIPDDGFDLLAHIRAVPGVALAELDWLRLDPLQQAPTGAKWNREDIGLEGAWAKGRGAGRGSVAVIDTGVDLDHPALAGSGPPGTPARRSPARLVDGAHRRRPGRPAKEPRHLAHG